MSRAMKAGAFGAAIGLFVMICILIFQLHSSMVVNALLPTHFLEKTSIGMLWMLTFGLFGFFVNAFFYGLIGYGIGKLMDGNERPKQPSR